MSQYWVSVKKKYVHATKPHTEQECQCIVTLEQLEEQNPECLLETETESNQNFFFFNVAEKRHQPEDLDMIQDTRDITETELFIHGFSKSIKC